MTAKVNKLLAIIVLGALFFFVFPMLDSAMGQNHTVEKPDNHPEEGQNEEHAKWQPLNVLAKEALDLVQKKEYAEAKSRVQTLADSFLDIQIGQYVQYPEQAYLIYETIIQAKEALTTAELDDKNIQKKVLRMGLTLQAVSHETAPLWLEYYAVIEKTIMELQYSLKEEDRDQFFLHVNRLSAHYELVRPAIVVSHSPNIYQQLDAHMAYFLNQRSQLWEDTNRTQQMVASLHQQLKVAFFQQGFEKHSFFYILLGITALVCSILAYVVWKKYQGENQHQKVPWKDFGSS